MTRIGFHASHEQFTPGELLELVQRAEQAGFDAAMCSDHFHPWSQSQGQSGFAWSWLGAALATTRLPFGVVTSPVGRYHPAVIAQAAATLAQMFEGRFWMAAGSGEVLNEGITGEPWPPHQQRRQRMHEAVSIMRRLWSGEDVTHHGAVTIEQARLYTRPKQAPPVYVAALSEETARWAGGWADGLITISLPHGRLKSVIDAFHEGGGEGKPLLLQVKLSYDDTDDAALAGAHAQWRFNVFDNAIAAELRTPQQFEAAAKHVKREAMSDAVRISSDPQRQVAWLQKDIELGFSDIYLHNVNRRQREFVDAFGEQVLPALRGASPKKKQANKSRKE